MSDTLLRHEITAGTQGILPSTIALSMGFGAAVLSDRLLEPLELGSYV